METSHAYIPNQIFPIVGNDSILLDGDRMKMASMRYLTYKNKGYRCVTCGLEGVFFLKQRDFKGHPYHLNLYGVTSKGERVLMTMDHILPASRGGRTELPNLQPMCAPCNALKGDRVMSPVDSVIPLRAPRWDVAGKPGVYRQTAVSLGGYRKLYTVRTR